MDILTLWNTLLVHPVMNLTIFAYSFIRDFGLAVIIATVVIRLACEATDSATAQDIVVTVRREANSADFSALRAAAAAALGTARHSRE